MGRFLLLFYIVRIVFRKRLCALSEGRPGAKFVDFIELLRHILCVTSYQRTFYKND